MQKSCGGNVLHLNQKQPGNIGLSGTRGGECWRGEQACHASLARLIIRALYLALKFKGVSRSCASLEF